MEAAFRYFIWDLIAVNTWCLVFYDNLKLKQNTLLITSPITYWFGSVIVCGIPLTFTRP